MDEVAPHPADHDPAEGTQPVFPPLLLDEHVLSGLARLAKQAPVLLLAVELAQYAELRPGEPGEMEHDPAERLARALASRIQQLDGPTRAADAGPPGLAFQHRLDLAAVRPGKRRIAGGDGLNQREHTAEIHDRSGQTGHWPAAGFYHIG